MFRRKKQSTPSGPSDAGREDDPRPREDAVEGPREPTLTPFPSREPRLEAVRAPSAAVPLHEDPATMTDKPTAAARPTPVASVPSPPSRNPLSHLPHVSEPMRRPNYPGIPGMGATTERARPSIEGRKLIVGRDIELSGTIAACDTLVVEGRVDSNLNHASVIEITANGTFHGTAEVDHAEIAGTFEGDLTVNKKLSLARTGRVVGTVRYGTLEVEAGGQIQGKAEVIGGEPKEPRLI